MLDAADLAILEVRRGDDPDIAKLIEMVRDLRGAIKDLEWEVADLQDELDRL